MNAFAKDLVNKTLGLRLQVIVEICQDFYLVLFHSILTCSQCSVHSENATGF